MKNRMAELRTLIDKYETIILQYRDRIAPLYFRGIAAGLIKAYNIFDHSTPTPPAKPKLGRPKKKARRRKA